MKLNPPIIRGRLPSFSTVKHCKKKQKTNHLKNYIFQCDILQKNYKQGHYSLFGSDNSAEGNINQAEPGLIVD